MLCVSIYLFTMHKSFVSERIIFKTEDWTAPITEYSLMMKKSMLKYPVHVKAKIRFHRHGKVAIEHSTVERLKISI